MVYVRAELALEAVRWAIRLSRTAPDFCNQCIACCLRYIERGLREGRDVPPKRWLFVDDWKLREGRPPETDLSATSLRRLIANQQNEYQQALARLEKFERAFHVGELKLKLVFQVQKGPKGRGEAERWPDKLRRTASYFAVKPNELANWMIAAGLVALEREDPDYEPDFIAEYRQKVVFPRITEFQNEQKLAERFNAHSDVPQELENDDWAFMRLVVVTSLHYRDLVTGFMERKTIEEVLSKVSRVRHRAKPISIN